MVRVELCVQDHHVMEQMTVCDQDAVGPGEHLLASTAHAPRPPVLQPRFLPWEEVPAQIFQARHGHGRRNLLIPRPPLWRCKVGVKIADHQYHRPLGPLSDGREGVLYCQGVVWGQVAPHDVPPLDVQRHMEAHNVRAIDLKYLH